MKTTAKKLVELIEKNCSNNNVPFKIDGSIRINELRKHIIIARLNADMIFYYSPKAFYNLYNNETIKRFDQIIIEDMLVG